MTTPIPDDATPTAASPTVASPVVPSPVVPSPVVTDVISTHAFIGLHHAQLAIPPGGEDAARAYYRDALGMTELAKPPALAARGGCWFRQGGLELHLGVEADFRPATKAHPGILVTDLDALAATLVARGLDVHWDDHFPGHRRFYSHDLHGNRIELLEAGRHGLG